MLSYVPRAHLELCWWSPLMPGSQRQEYQHQQSVSQLSGQAQRLADRGYQLQKYKKQKERVDKRKRTRFVTMSWHTKNAFTGEKTCLTVGYLVSYLRQLLTQVYNAYPTQTPPKAAWWFQLQMRKKSQGGSGWGWITLQWKQQWNWTLQWNPSRRTPP